MEERNIQKEISDIMAQRKIAIKSKFVPFSQSRHANEKTKTLNWIIEIYKNGRMIYSGAFSRGQAFCPSYNKPMPKDWNFGRTQWPKLAVELECEQGYPAKHKCGGITKAPKSKQIAPNPCDVIAVMLHEAEAINYASFEDWAWECGYDADSRKAYETYSICLACGLKLRNGFGEKVFAELFTLAQDY